MENNLEDAIVSTIGSADIESGLVDLAEVGLDQLFADGVIRDIPVLGTLVAAVRGIGHVREWLLAKNWPRSSSP